MLFDQWGHRQYTEKECALLEEGARCLAGDVIEGDSSFFTSVEEFDRMSVEEKLVTLHILCINAASDEEPKGREMWLDATLMAALETLKAHVEIAFDLYDEDEALVSSEVEELTRLILASRLSHNCDIDAIRMVPCEERSELDYALFQMQEGKDVSPLVSRDVLLEILEEYRDRFFLDWDFMDSEGVLDLAPPEHEAITAQMGVDPGYHINTAPSCSPQAVRAARHFLLGGVQK